MKNKVVKSNKAFESLQENLNILTDTRKILLNPEFIYMDIVNNAFNYDKYEYEYLKLYKNIDPIIFHIYLFPIMAIMFFLL